MTRPARLCTCGQIVPHGVACACQIAAKRARDRRHDRRRPSSTARGYTAEWRRKSREWLELHPDCAMCRRPADLVDHIFPHKGDQTLFWDLRNWQALCRSCHNGMKQKSERELRS